MSTSNDDDFANGIGLGIFLTIAIEVLLAFIIYCTTSKNEAINSKEIRLEYVCDSAETKVEMIPEMVNIVTNAGMKLTNVTDGYIGKSKTIVVTGSN